jgi:hypothetical protein
MGLSYDALRAVSADQARCSRTQIYVTSRRASVREGRDEAVQVRRRNSAVLEQEMRCESDGRKCSTFERYGAIYTLCKPEKSRERWRSLD